MESNKKNILPALAAAIAAMPDPKKNAKNEFHGNRYADLGQVLECVAGPLAANGLVLTQTVDALGEACDVLTTTLWHAATGECIESRITLRPEKNTPQGLASAITYARRYAIKALFGMVDVDDDGNEASRPTQPARIQETPRVGTTRMELEALMNEARDLDILRQVGMRVAAAKLGGADKAALKVRYAERLVQLTPPQETP